MVYYVDGKKSYILAPKDLVINQVIVSGFSVPIIIGNSLPLWNIPLGTNVHNLELYPGCGGQVARAAGTSVQLIARKKGFVTMYFPSGEIRIVLQTCWATVGQVGNVEVGIRKFKKAGRIRWLRYRPTVRGSAMNPVDHPHGGGEGKTSGGRPSVTPYGIITKNKPTRRKNKKKRIFNG